MNVFHLQPLLECVNPSIRQQAGRHAKVLYILLQCFISIQFPVTDYQGTKLLRERELSDKLSI
jgi:hypothetical protein